MPYSWNQEVSITTAADTTDEIILSNAVRGVVHVRHDETLTTLNVHVTDEAGGTYEQLIDASGNVVITVTADQARMIPDDAFGAAAIKLVGDAAGTVYVSLVTD